MSDSRTDLPSPNAPNFEQRVREALMTYMGRTGNPMDRGLTLRDLLDNGFATLPAGYTLRPGGQLPPLVPGTTIRNPELDLTPPPQPTGFQVASAISHVFIEHDAPLYLQGGGHLRTRVYGVTMEPGDPLPVFGDAVEITQFSGTVHAHPSNPATTWRLWIKWESQAGVLSPTPAGGTNGLLVTTAQDVSLLLEALNGEITESQLDAALEGRVDLIDGGVGVAGSVNSRIQAEVDARTLSVYAEAVARQLADSVLSSAQGLLGSDIRNTAGSLLTEVSARQIADSALSSAQALLASGIRDTAGSLLIEAGARQIADSAIQGAVASTGVAVGQANASIATERSQRVDGDLATASLVTSLTASQTETAAALQVEQSVRAGADSAQAAQTVTLAALAQGSAAALVVEQQVRSDEDSALSSQTTTLAAATGANAAALQVEQQVRSDEDSALASQTTTLAAATGANTAALRVEQQARSDEDSAQAGQLTVLTAATANTTAGLFSEQSVRASSDSAQAGSVAGLAVASQGNSAGLLTEQQARVSSDGAISSQVSGLSAASGANAAAITVEATARTTGDSSLSSQITILSASTGATSAALQNEITVRASETGALAQQVTTLQAVNEADATALEIEALVRTIETETLLGQYTVKIDSNGYVTGFGLASEKVNGRVVSSFGVRADRFFIASPAGPGIAPTMPFVVQTTPTDVGGVAVDPGVYITDAFIQNGTITNVKIANLAIDSAKISGLTVDKLLAGSIAVGQHIQSTGYVSGSAGWRIDGGGNAEFSNVTVRGTVVGSTITGGTITGSVITGATVQTAASGQRIQMDTSGLLFLTGTSFGKYGTFKRGTARKYGAGVLVYFNNAAKRVPFYVAAEQNVADIHLYNRGADPTGATYEAGDMICVNGRLKIYVPALGGWKTLALEP